MGTTQSTESLFNISEDCMIKQYTTISNYYTQTEYKINCHTFNKTINIFKEFLDLIIIFSENKNQKTISFYNIECKNIQKSYNYSTKIQYFIVNNQFFIITFNEKNITLEVLYPEYKLLMNDVISHSSSALLNMMYDYYYGNTITNLTTLIYNYNDYLIFEYNYVLANEKKCHVIIINNFKTYHTFSGNNIICLCKNNIIITRNTKTNKYAYYNVNLKKCANTNREFVDIVNDLIIEYDKGKIIISSVKSLIFKDNIEDEYIIID